MNVPEVLCTVSFCATCPDWSGMGWTALFSETQKLKRKKRPKGIMYVYYELANLDFNLSKCSILF